MKILMRSFMLALSLLLLCSAGASAQQSVAGQQEIHHSTGIVTQINAARGLIIVWHPPIPSLDWEEMTMVLPVTDKKLLAGIGKGDHVEFDLIMPNDVATISKISVVKKGR